MEADDDDDDDKHGYEYATLACRRGRASAIAKVYLKVAFYEDAADDRTRTALRASAIVDDVSGDFGGLYQGHVLGEQAAEQSPRDATGHDDDHEDRSAAVRAWSRDARAALLGSGDGKPTAAEYEYHLGRDAVATAQLTLTWKMKLRPFGLMPLGAVRLTVATVAADPLGPTCDRFVGPLIRALTVERDRRRLSDMESADVERHRSADNRRLLDAMRSMADGRRADDHRLMARCLELLNAKKRRIADLQQQLADLKRDVPQPPVVEEPPTERRRRGRGAGRGRAGSIKKVKRSEHMEWRLSSSPDDPSGKMIVDAPIDPRYFADTQIDSPTRLQHSATVSLPTGGQPSPDRHHEHQPPAGKSVLDNPWSPSIPAVGAPVDPRYFADTQIDSPNRSPPTRGQPSPDRHSKHQPPVQNSVLDNLFSPSSPASTKVPFSTDAVDVPVDTQIDSPYSSPPWLQPPVTLSPPTRGQPSPDGHYEHRPPVKKSVLDDLWSGIL